MRVAIHDHQGKSAMLREALVKGGYKVTGDNQIGDVLLIDFDAAPMYERIIEKHVIGGSKVLLYSHGAMPIVAWDGPWRPSDRVNGYLAMSPGQKEVMERYGYPYPIHVIGWYYCGLKDFQPTDRPMRVLFAPWHPHSNGYLMPEGKGLNTSIMRDLVQMLPSIRLTVRHARTLHQNGLWEEAGVNYEEANMGIEAAVASIDAADLVISHGTLAYLAVARGKPTILYGQDVRPHDGDTPKSLRYVDSWEAYREYMRYPLDYGDGPLDEMMRRAGREEPTNWKARFIGAPLDPATLFEILEREVGEVVYA